MKRIVICSDGTWQTPNQKNPTHVVEMARTVSPTAPDGTTQVVFYDWGVGTEVWMRRIAGGISGQGIRRNIRDCYRFLVHNYEDGDEVYLFGFSRGAYTVRSLAGLIRNCGVLRKTEAAWIDEAYDMYCRNDAAPESEEAKRFRSAHSQDVSITFIGVWDTVGALGIPVRGLSKWTDSLRQFHDVELSSYVKYGCHALAIDERRGPFRPSLWQAKPKPGQIVEQVWFSGEHSDVGGAADPTLGEPALAWMKERASYAGLAFDSTPATPTPTQKAGWLKQIMARLGRLLAILLAQASIVTGVAWLQRQLSPSRQIGLDETQSVHPSARDRYAGDPSKPR